MIGLLGSATHIGALSMSIELEKELFSKVMPLSEDLSHFLALKSLLAGATPSRVWVDNKAIPSSALIWDQVNMFFFIVGDTRNWKFNEEVSKLLAEKIIPEITELQYDCFYLQVAPDSWNQMLDQVLAGKKLNRKKIHCYTYKTDNVTIIENWREKIPSPFQMKRITSSVLANKPLKNAEELNYCIQACWRSIEKYLQKGIGFCLLHNETIASWCSTDFIIDDKCELYVETFQGYKQKGLATLAVSACLEECLNKKYAIHWHCWDANLASIKLAKNLGFEKKAEKSVYFFKISGMNNY
ncbi:MAG: GNAT family N-acetyltransferase [Candidatus Hodarchaeota archaeon]